MGDYRRAVMAAVLCTWALCPAAQAKVIYVDDDANGLNDGSSWVNAYRFLRDALADAKLAEKPVEVRVARGVYRPDRSSANPTGTLRRDAAFLLSDGMSLLGGYAGVLAQDPNARDVKSYETVLSGDLLGNDAPVTDPASLENDRTRNDNSNVLTITTSGGPVRLEGCVITGGTYGTVTVGRPGNSPGDSDVIIRDCVFRDNGPTGGDAPAASALGDSAGATILRCSFIRNGGARSAVVGAKVVEGCQFISNYDWGSFGGGGADLHNSTVTDCTFAENRARTHGGALTADWSSKIVRCTFRNNSASFGGAVYGDECSAEMTGCVFAGNRSSRQGGAVCMSGQQLTLSNCVFSGNRAVETGGATDCHVMLLTVSNCTFSGNRAYAGGALATHGKNAVVRDSIFWDNQAARSSSQSLYGSLSAAAVSYSLLQGSAADASLDSTNQPLWGPGNLDADPCFAVPGRWDPNGTPDDPNDDYFVEGDYHLRGCVRSRDRG